MLAAAALGATGGAMADAVTRKVKTFSWPVVPSGVTRQLLLAAYRVAKEDAAIDEIAGLDEERLARQAEKVFGRAGISKRHHGVATPVLRRQWLPLVPAQELVEFARMVQLGLTGEARRARLVTKSEALAFLEKRKATETFTVNLMKAFTRLNKVERIVDVPPRPPKPHVSPNGPMELEGKNEPNRMTPYEHQRLAWRRLDELANGSGRRAGLLVLPTGAGKTFTMVVWLLRQLAKDPEVRVLWVADQQELVEQAARVFAELAPTMPVGTIRQMRVLHGAAGSVSHLASDSLDVACVTRQSVVGAQFNALAKKRLATFLQRPTVVVVDEAHHAVATQYHELLDFIEHQTDRALYVGLTATPWPSGSGMTKRLHERFNTTVAQVEVRDLVKSGILAVPIVHTYDTAVSVRINAEEAKRIAQQDIPGDVLRRLDQEPRTQMIVRTWLSRHEEWGKTLVFAPTIENADHLGDAFRAADVKTWVVHTKAEIHRGEAIQEFRDHVGPSVLVSVGMLREGVDLPDAKTAFLARPTTSRILMRQMIGRVLRGPKAGGDEHANIVDLRDRWGADVDVLAPAELADLEVVLEDPTERELSLPPIVDEETNEPISELVLRRIEVAYEELWLELVPDAGAFSSTRLVGFYDLGDANVPVFEHCQDAWDQLIQRVLGNSKSRRAHLDLFDDCRIPRPPERDVRDVVAFCRSHQEAPPLVPVAVTFSVRAVARKLLEQPPMTEADKHAWLHDAWATSLGRVAFPSYQRFAEEVQREVFQIAGGLTKNDPESWPEDLPSASNLPPLQETDRDLASLLKATVTEGRAILAGEADYRACLAPDELPACEWTKTRPRGVWAYWAPRIAGRNKSMPVIRINRVLKAHPALVPDRLIEALIWHELCHHLLPGRGHDAEFRRLESLWPDSAEQDSRLDRLHEEFDLQMNPRRATPATPEPTRAAPTR